MLRLLCLAALLVPASVIANEPSAPATTATVASKPALDPDKPVCKRVMTTGSNILGKKVCVSRRERDAKQRANRDEVARMTSGGGHQSGN